MSEEEYWKAVGDVEEAFNFSERRRALLYLLSVDHPETVATFRKYFLAERDSALADALGAAALGRWGDAFLSEIPFESLGEYEKHNVLRVAPKMASGHSLLIKAFQDPSREVRRLAAVGLGHRPGCSPEVLNLLKERATGDREHDVRVECIKALAAQPDPESLEILESLAEGDEVEPEVFQALEDIQEHIQKEKIRLQVAENENLRRSSWKEGRLYAFLQYLADLTASAVRVVRGRTLPGDSALVRRGVSFIVAILLVAACALLAAYSFQAARASRAAEPFPCPHCGREIRVNAGPGDVCPFCKEPLFAGKSDKSPPTGFWPVTGKGEEP